MRKTLSLVMMQRKLIALFAITIMLSLLSGASHAQKYFFYLHGKIVEDQGVGAVAPGYGAYEYEHILQAFRKEQFTVMSEVRAKNTDPETYARKVVRQIDSLLKTGVKPNKITVLGASKGSVIAQYVSSILKNKDVNFVFMAGCSGDGGGVNFCGNILSIYEKSDGVGSCNDLKNKSSNSIPHYKEIELNTGLRHGFLYKPLPEWVAPSVQWANGNYQ